MSDAPDLTRLYIRGTVSNGFGLGALWALAVYLNLAPYVAIALGIQYATFALHGYPQRSEKLYDLSGSATHLAVVFAALLGVEPSATLSVPTLATPVGGP